MIQYIRSKPNVKSLIKFGTVGAVCVLVDFSVFYILFEKFQLSKLKANIGSTIFGIITNYILNRAWTFRSKEPWKKEFIKFVSISLIGLSFNNIIVFYGTEYTLEFLNFICNLKEFNSLFICNNSEKWSIYLTKVMAIVIVFFWNFYVNSRFNFKKSK